MVCCPLGSNKIRTRSRRILEVLVRGKELTAKREQCVRNEKRVVAFHGGNETFQGDSIPESARKGMKFRNRTGRSHFLAMGHCYLWYFGAIQHKVTRVHLGQDEKSEECTQLWLLRLGGSPSCA